MIGEVLFDQFPNGETVLGGAPFNVAWNLRGFGQRPLFVSATGQDETGDQVRQQMRSWGMDTACLQSLSEHPTGRVTVTLESGQPSYEILSDQAYDFVDFERLDSTCHQAIKEAALMYHGSLAWRSPTTRNTMLKLRRELSVPVFVDLNIRQPWFDSDWLDAILSGVTWLKLNVDELAELCGRTLNENSSPASVGQAVADLKQRYPFEVCFVTAGDAGAYAIDANRQIVFQPTPKVERVVDTVGAGDAFAAIAIHGLLEGWGQPEILQHAVNFAARVCQINGATVDDPAFYQLAPTAS